MYQAHVYGKGHGCSKCTIMKQRITSLLQQPEYSDFEMVFHDVLTEDGLVDFLKAEVLNPMRIPGLLITEDNKPIELDPESLGIEQYLPSATGSRLGIQTDYDHGGVITPDTIKALFDRAKGKRI